MAERCRLENMRGRITRILDSFKPPSGSGGGSLT
jgi:hypothetical protein